MQTFQFNFRTPANSKAWSLATYPQPGVTPWRSQVVGWQRNLRNFWDGRSVAVSVSIGGAPPLFSILIATIHGGLFGRH
jgi:hypothetical protein